MRHLRGSEIGLVLVHVPTAIVVTQVASFYSFVGRARLALGRWPAPYRPDPKDLDFSSHHLLLWVGCLISALTPFLLLTTYSAAATLRVSSSHLRVAAAVFALCYLGAATLWFVDPGKFGEWFRD